MPEADGPIIILGNKLSSLGVPSLSVLIAQISDSESYAVFLDLVNEFLPERRQEILHETTPYAQVARFAGYFEDRYFPLDQIIRMGDVESYDELTHHIPLIVMGISWDDYEEITSECRPGIQLMTYLSFNPWGEEPSVSLAEACAEHVPQDLLGRAAEIQLEPGEAHRLLDGTQYEMVAHWADRIHCCTNNFFLDNDYEMLMNSMPPDWDRETVEALTRQWQQADAAESRLNDFVEWLEAAPSSRFEELVNFILEKKENESRTDRRT